MAARGWTLSSRALELSGKNIYHTTQREQGYNSPLGRAADSEACGREEFVPQ